MVEGSSRDFANFVLDVEGQFVHQEILEDDRHAFGLFQSPDLVLLNGITVC